jgi:catechol 2,3-dioxygenase-like lactoylglutathione lyase family enzyme
MDATWHHMAISVKDIDESLKFYRDLLGFEVDWEKDHYGGEAFSSIAGFSEAEARIVLRRQG